MTATKICLRKFILRIVKITNEERSVHNLPNLVFMVYLVIFNNSPFGPNHADHLFLYFKPLSKFLFLNKFSFISKEQIQLENKVQFVDYKLIIETIASFKF